MHLLQDFSSLINRRRLLLGEKNARLGHKHTMIPSLALPFILLVLILFAPPSNASCPPTGCGPFGICYTWEEICYTACDCNKGYSGYDCSQRAVRCDDQIGPNGEVTCFNGGECLEVYDAFTGAFKEWICDCRQAVGEAAVYAGFQCEFPAEQSCLLDASVVSLYAFCTNGGICKGRVKDGQPHPGCICPAKFGGRHCQYNPGDVPTDELKFEARSAESSDPKLSGIGVFLVTMLALAFLGGMGYVVLDLRHKSRSAFGNGYDHNVPTSPRNNSLPMDLALDEGDDSGSGGVGHPEDNDSELI
jgi:hypothetical protein